MRSLEISASVVLAVFLLASQPLPAEAARGLFQWGDEAIIKVADLPDTRDYQMEDGTYVDVGIIYKSVAILFCPVWNYDMRWAGYLGSDDTYLPMEEQELRDLAATAGVTLPETFELPLWDTIGGKLVIGGGLLALILFQLYKRRRSA
jgi:hypothetical protein